MNLLITPTMITPAHELETIPHDGTVHLWCAAELPEEASLPTVLAAILDEEVAS